MKVYQVGGSVRDELMGLTPKDYDFVVVGSSEKELLSLGYTKVGQDFPVFHHPETKDEYALARKEKKTGQGYLGFSTETEGVSLEEDLFRRDLTINSMAKDEEGNLIDPYGGKKDLQSKVLRHVSPHFSEDPLRALRVARFAARYPDFSVAPETMELMKELTRTELKFLSKERFFKEFDRALQEKSAFRFLEVLRDMGFFEHFLPEFTFGEDLKSLDQAASSLAKVLVMTRQDKRALEAAKKKLGFNSHILEEAFKLLGTLSKERSLESLPETLLKTRLHDKEQLRSLLEESFLLLGKDTKVFREIEKIKETLKRMDFSFVTELPVHERKGAQLKSLLEELKKG